MTSPAGAAAAAPGAAQPSPAAPLDDVMLAMDVVDTLRRRERMVARELAEDGREADLKERLRKVYAAQGIEVPDHILEEGVRALKEDRFVYKPPGPGLGRMLANVYVARKRWGKWVAGGLVVVIAAFLLNYFVVIAPTSALPGDLAKAHAEVTAIAQTADATAAAARLLTAGQAAVKTGDTEKARQALEALRTMEAVLAQEYTLQIVNKPDMPTGVWRVPDVNTKARNYYILVQAVDASGQLVRVPVKNEETGKTETVQTWGLRVDRSVFENIARDKRDDGIIQQNQFGYKKRGQLVPEYSVATTGAAITAW